MTTAKTEVFIGLSHENCYLQGGGGYLWWAENLLGGIFQLGGISKFSASGGATPTVSVWKTLSLGPKS